MNLNVSIYKTLLLKKAFHSPVDRKFSQYRGLNWSDASLKERAGSWIFRNDSFSAATIITDLRT